MEHLFLASELSGCSHGAFPSVFGVGRGWYYTVTEEVRTLSMGELDANFQGEQSEEERPLVQVAGDGGTQKLNILRHLYSCIGDE